MHPSLTSTLISGTQSTCCASVTGCSDLRRVGEIESRRKVDVMNLFSETAESYELLKRFAVEYVLICTFYKSPPTLPNTFEQVGCFPTHVQTCRRASCVVRCSMSFETNVAGCASVLCY